MNGEQLSPILIEIESALLDHQVFDGSKLDFSMEAFRAVIKIFMDAMLDKMWELQQSENISMKDRVAMAVELGNEVRKLVKIYTNIDTHKLYEQYR